MWRKKVGALNFHSTLTKNKNVYVVMSGNFRPAQRQIVRNHCQIDLENFNLVYQWLKENNPNFSNMADSELCPKPIMAHKGILFVTGGFFAKVDLYQKKLRRSPSPLGS